MSLRYLEGVIRQPTRQPFSLADCVSFFRLIVRDVLRCLRFTGSHYVQNEYRYKHESRHTNTSNRSETHFFLKIAEGNFHPGDKMHKASDNPLLDLTPLDFDQRR
jgi:hypothetical protein